MKQPCGCCAGSESVTPESEANRPGLTAIAYRVGTYATFLETMVARLSSRYLEVPAADGSGTIQRIYPLRGLTTRDPGDPSIALLNAWATVADVLTFYQERIANEGYLRTATERRSILELARLVGYKLRPGVASSVYLAFTVSNGFQGEIPAGTRAQSIPGTGETAQFFETSDQLVARDTWNNLKPRLTRPQVITLNTARGMDADQRDTLYFQGISTNLKVGDALLIVLGDAAGQQALRTIESVAVQADQNRTQVILQVPSPERASSVADTVTSAVQPFIDDASNSFAGSDLAAQVAGILQGLLDRIPASRTVQQAADMVRGTVPQIQAQYDIAVSRQFTRLSAWLDHLGAALTLLAEGLQNMDLQDPAGSGTAPPRAATEASSPLTHLAAIIGPLAQPPSVQPANAVRLQRTVAQAFASQSDSAPRLLAAFKPAAAPALYQAWGKVATPASRVQVYAMRVKASLFGSNAPLRITGVVNGVVTQYDDWPLVVTVNANETVVSTIPVEDSGSVSLSSSYPQIQRGSWVVVDTSAVNVKGSSVVPSPGLLYARAGDVKADISRANYGMGGKTTRIPLLNPASLASIDWLNLNVPNAHPDQGTDFIAIRNTVVYAQAERLDLAEEPLDTDVEGNTIELADLYDGLESGRWIIVSGNRTDIPNVSGVTASELVMISGVAQGTQAPLCATFPSGVILFAEFYYTTSANALGDRLVVGKLSDTGVLNQHQLPLPAVVNQQYCDQVQLAAGVFANAYVPTQAERNGDFPDFQGLLVDPATGVPYAHGNIATAIKQDKIFAWRISSEPVHTILTLANKLAYKYDASTVAIYGNVVKATHGQTVGEVLGNGDASQAFQTFGLHQSPLTYLPAPTPAGAQSTLTVRVNEVDWHEADNLAGLGPTDRSFITRTNGTDQTSVIFGNGEHGARPPTGNVNIKALYRYGIGKPGNVKSQQISQLATRPLGVQGVINPLPATGGAARDSRDQAGRNAPLAVMALDRLVSVEDYADFARTYAGIGKASAARLSDGRRQVVHVTIAGADDIPIDQNSDLYRNLVQALQQNGDPYQAIQVCLRKVSLLVISAAVQVLADYPWESVEPEIRAALLDTFSFDRRDLGQSAFLSEAVSVMQGVEGVAYVDVQKFDAVSEDVTTDVGQLAGLAGTLGLDPYIKAELARINPAPDSATDPCQRILPAELVFLTPDIPDTLILTEISG